MAMSVMETRSMWWSHETGKLAVAHEPWYAVTAQWVDLPDGSGWNPPVHGGQCHACV